MLCLDGAPVSDKEEWFRWSNIYAETKLSPEPATFFATQNWYVYAKNVIFTFALHLLFYS